MSFTWKKETKKGNEKWGRVSKKTYNEHERRPDVMITAVSKLTFGTQNTKGKMRLVMPRSESLLIVIQKQLL